VRSPTEYRIVVLYIRQMSNAVWILHYRVRSKEK